MKKIIITLLLISTTHGQIIDFTEITKIVSKELNAKIYIDSEIKNFKVIYNKEKKKKRGYAYKIYQDIMESKNLYLRYNPKEKDYTVIKNKIYKMRYHRFNENKNKDIEVSRKQYKILTKKTELEMLKYENQRLQKKLNRRPNIEKSYKYYKSELKECKEIQKIKDKNIPIKIYMEIINKDKSIEKKCVLINDEDKKRIFKSKSNDYIKYNKTKRKNKNLINYNNQLKKENKRIKKEIKILIKKIDKLENN